MPTEIPVTEDSAETTIANLKAERDTLTTDLQAVTAERDDAKGKLDLLDGTLADRHASLAQTVSGLNAQLRDAYAEMTDLERRLALLRKPLETASRGF